MTPTQAIVAVLGGTVLGVIVQVLRWIGDSLLHGDRFPDSTDRPHEPRDDRRDELGGCSCGARFYSLEAVDNHDDVCPLDAP